MDLQPKEFTGLAHALLNLKPPSPTATTTTTLGVNGASTSTNNIPKANLRAFRVRQRGAYPPSPIPLERDLCLLRLLAAVVSTQGAWRVYAKNRRYSFFPSSFWYLDAPWIRIRQTILIIPSPPHTHPTLAWPLLEELDLSGNGIGDAGVELVAAWLEGTSKRRLKKLGLSMVNLSHRGLLRLLRPLAQVCLLWGGGGDMYNDGGGCGWVGVFFVFQSDDK